MPFDISMLFQMFSILIAMVFMPGAYYRTMKTDGGFFSPLIFIISMSLLAAIFNCGWVLAGGGEMIWMHCFENILKILALGIGGSIAASLVLFPVWKMLGSLHGFEAAFRSVAYAMAIFPVLMLLKIMALSLGLISITSYAFLLNPFSWIILLAVWGGLLMVLASKNVHHIQFPKAWTSALFYILPLILMAYILNFSPFNFSPIATDSHQQTVKTQQKSDSNKKVFTKKASNNDATPEEIGKAVAGFLTGLKKSGALDQSANRQKDKTPPKVSGKDLDGLTISNKIEPTPEQQLILDVDDIYGYIIGSVQGHENASGKWYEIQVDTNDYSQFESLYFQAQVNHSTNNSPTASVSSNSARDAAEAASVTPTSKAAEIDKYANSRFERTVNVSYSQIYAYDEDGNAIRGISCEVATLLFPARDENTETINGLILWLFCPNDTHSEISQYKE